MLFAKPRTLPFTISRFAGQPAAVAVAPSARKGMAGTHFAAHRAQHMVELIGACVMMAAFLVVALFA